MILFKDSRELKVMSRVQRIYIIGSTPSGHRCRDTETHGLVYTYYIGAGGEPTKIVTNINIFQM